METREPVRLLEGRETAACPADRHRHSRRGWFKDGCRCPSTAAAYEAHKETARLAAQRRRRSASRNLPHRIEDDREIDDCPADWHRHDRRGWRAGCRCPSTVKAYERVRDQRRAANRRWREAHRDDPKNPNIAQFDLHRADRLDAEAIAMGYRTGQVSKHTRALAIRMMIQADPYLSDRRITWRLQQAGQTGRGGSHIDCRSVQRIVRSLNMKLRRAGEPPLLRLARADDDPTATYSWRP